MCRRTSCVGRPFQSRPGSTQLAVALGIALGPGLADNFLMTMCDAANLYLVYLVYVSLFVTAFLLFSLCFW